MIFKNKYVGTFFSLLFIFHGSINFANSVSVCVKPESINEQAKVSRFIVSVDEDIIQTYKNKIKRDQHINRWIRFGAKGVVGLASVVAAGYYIKHFFKVPLSLPEHAVEASDTVSLAMFNKLKGKVRQLQDTIGVKSRFLSFRWFKAFAIQMCINPITILHVIDLSKRLIEKRIFHDVDMKWFLASHTNLGSIATQFNDQHFVLGATLRELCYCAQKLDDGARALYRQKHFSESITLLMRRVVENIEKVIAFMEYETEQLPLTEKERAIAQSLSRYLFNCTSDFCHSVEQFLIGKSERQLLPVVKEFIAECEHVIVHFVHLEEDSSVCHNMHI